MTPVPPSVHSRALGMLVLANLFWGLSFPLVKGLGMTHAMLDPDAPETLLTVYTVAPRFLIAVLVLGVWRWRDIVSTTRLELQQGLVLAFYCAVGMLFQNYGLRYTDASTSAFLTQLYAILIPLWMAVRLRRSPGPLVWTSALMVLAGVAILGRFDWTSFTLGRGETATLLCSVFFMGQILALENPRYASNRPWPLTFVMFVGVGVSFCLSALWSAPETADLLIPWSSPAWLGMTIVLSLACTVGSYSLMNAWQPKITATEAGLIYCIEPVFGSVMALFLPAWISIAAGVAYANERGSWALLIGGGLITLANIVLQLRPPKKEAA